MAKKAMSKSGRSKEKKFVACTLKSLPETELLAAARTAVELNPSNAPRTDHVPTFFTALVEDSGASPSAQEEVAYSVQPATPDHLALLTTKYWGAKGVDLSVSFMETTNAPLRDKILAHMNAWGQYGNVRFRWTQSGGQVRISRARGGYWSYLGTDILHVPANQQTMNLEGFTLNTSDSEYTRVVRHETGHTLGFPHEHLRSQLIARLDRNKTLAYFERTQGWDEATVVSNLLTPLDEATLKATPQADEISIMTYQLPGSITTDGRPIQGGSDIDPLDQQFVALIYPKQGGGGNGGTGKTHIVLEFGVDVPLPTVTKTASGTAGGTEV